MRRRLQRAIRLMVKDWRARHGRRRALARWGETGPAGTTVDGRVTLARIIGNDLYPRHAEGQALRNLSFILENEPSFPGCRKLFVLNRIFEPGIQARAERLIAEHGHSALVIPFSGADYAAQACDASFFGGEGYFESAAFEALNENERFNARLGACFARVRYAMNINGARNAALDWGRGQGSWTIVLDGSCFVAAPAWELLAADMATAPVLPYLVIPMRRLPSNEDVNRPPLPDDSAEEPQIAFHASAQERFDEAYPYGLRDKTSLLARIGVPGAWDRYGAVPWLPAPSDPSPQQYLYKHARACVFRLSSGVAGGTLERPDALRKRNLSRIDAIFRTLAMLDDRYGPLDLDTARRIMGVQDASDMIKEAGE